MISEHCSTELESGLTVAVIPDMRDVNPYQSLLKAALEERGLVLRFPDEFGGKRPLLEALVARRFQVLHIDWIHPYVAGGSGLHSIVKGTVFVAKVVFARLLGRRIVWTVHNVSGHDSSVARLERAVGRVLALVAHRLIVHYPKAAEIVHSSFGVPLEKILVAPHGNFVDVYGMPKRRRPPGAGIEPLVFLAFGLIRPYKRLDGLIEAFARVHSPDVRLAIVGQPIDEDYAEEIRSLAEKDDRVSLHFGLVEDNRVAQVFADADVATATQDAILTSGSLILAMSMGVPILAADTSHAEFLLANGVSENALCRPGDIDDLADAIGRLEANRASLPDLGAQNRERISTFTWARMAEVVDQAYRGAEPKGGDARE